MFSGYIDDDDDDDDDADVAVDDDGALRAIFELLRFEVSFIALSAVLSCMLKQDA